MMKILTIANRKGGASKSTLAAHIAMHATNESLKTILIDMDPQKTLEGWWEKRNEDLPALVDVTAGELNEKIPLLIKNDFDLCVIDTPGDTTGNAESGIQAADVVLIPCKPTPADLGAVGKTISQVRDKHNKDYFFVITQAPPSSQVHLQATAVLSEFGPVCPTSMMSRKAYADVIGTGDSASSYNKLANNEISAIWLHVKQKLGMLDKRSKKKVDL